jgi:hypothetical protein
VGHKRKLAALRSEECRRQSRPLFGEDQSKSRLSWRVLMTTSAEGWQRHHDVHTHPKAPPECRRYEPRADIAGNGGAEPPPAPPQLCRKRHRALTAIWLDHVKASVITLLINPKSRIVRIAALWAGLARHGECVWTSAFRPVLCARRTASARVRADSFKNIRLRCDLIVSGATPSWMAMALFV